MKKNGFGLIELIMVIITVGVLTTIALTNSTSTRNDALDREAIANLKIIRDAERIYKLENGRYYMGGTIAQINRNLKISLPIGGAWNYRFYFSGRCYLAERYAAPGLRWWHLFSYEEEPSLGYCSAPLE